MSKKLKCIIGVTVVSFVLILLVQLFKDYVILYYGIRVFRMLRNLTSGLGIALASISIVLCILTLRASKKSSTVSGENDDCGLSRVEKSEIELQLFNALPKNSSVYKNAAMHLVKQLESTQTLMKNMQKLSGIDKDCKEATDAIQLISKLETCMYYNIRKLINYVYVIDHVNSTLIEQKLSNCYNENESLVNKANDFAMAVADFINKDTDDDEQALAQINAYKEVVLETIDLADAYLD